LTIFGSYNSLVTEITAGLFGRGRCPVNARIEERRAAKMKKRKLLKRNGYLKLCGYLLLALAFLSTNVDLHGQPKLKDVYFQEAYISAATDVCTSLQNPKAKPRFAERDTRVWVPIELAPHDGLCDPVAADYSIRDLSYQVLLNLPESVVVVDIPEPEPMPVFLYVSFVVAFGLVGFFVPASSPVRHLRRHRPALGLRNS
jgi:hypothetical protein